MSTKFLYLCLCHFVVRGCYPAERHAGLDGEILQERKLILEKARKANPNRWSGSVRNSEPTGAVMLNPDLDETLS